MAVSLTLPAHATHRHEWYGLTCELYEELLLERGQCCWICGCPAEKSTSAGKLYIDHDHDVGQWAVRGLLCHPHNVVLRHDRQAPAQAQPYLSDPWYMRMLSERGLHSAVPEYDKWTVNSRGWLNPPQMRDFKGRVWTWNEDARAWGHALSICWYPWSALLYRFGPHNLAPYVREDTRVVTAGEAREIRAKRRQASPPPHRTVGDARVVAALSYMGEQKWAPEDERKIRALASILGGGA